LRYQLLPCSYALHHPLVPDSDSLYHRLFAHPRMVEELVREFVPRKRVADLDFSGLQRVNSKFHPSRRSARRREGDVIWRLPTREDSDIYLYLPATDSILIAPLSLASRHLQADHKYLCGVTEV